MTETICGVRCEYIANLSHDKGPCMLFLHGWGGDIHSFSGVFGAACDWGINAVNFAFPKEVPPSWGIYDYAELVIEFIKHLGIVRPIVVGHSFGGRIAIILASQGLCSKIVLVDSAGLKPRFSLRKKIAVARYHRARKLGKALDGMGSIDYNNTAVGQRSVFVRIVNSHLDGLLGYIDCPTLVVWGDKDKETPMYMARRLVRHIKDSSLAVLDGGHYAYADSHFGFVRTVKAFVMDV